MNRRTLIITSVLAVVLMLVPTCILVDDSSAEDINVEGTNIWFCYGRNITVQDYNYDSTKYSHIEWRYSLIQSELDTIDPVEEIVLKFSVPYDICPDDEYIVYYVRETATVSGVEMHEDLIININPSSYVRYVDFMYNDGTSTVYKHVPVSSDKCYAYGSQYLANPPSVDPIRPGYRFAGWYEEAACVTEYTKATYHLFKGSDITMQVYAKWVEDPSFQPGYDMVKIDLQPVNGLRFEYDGLVIPEGTDFTYTASTFNNYHYDLSNAVSTRINSDPIVVLDKSGSGVEPVFTLKSVDMDSVVVLTGAVRSYNIYDDLTDVLLTSYTTPASGSLQLTLSLPEGSQYNNIEASVWMGGVNVTGNVLSNNVISIGNLTGDVYIFAYADKKGYTVTIVPNNTSYGKVSPTEITGVEEGTKIVVDGNTLTIGSTVVTASAAESSGSTSYSFSGWSIASGTITGDTGITANFEKSTASSDFPWWILAAIGAAAAALLILFLLFRGKGKNVVLSSSDSSYSAVSSKDFDGKTMQFVELAVGTEMSPVYSFVRSKDSYIRHDYMFYGKDLPEGIVVREDGTICGTLAGPKNVGDVGTFYVVAVKRPDSDDQDSKDKDPEEQKPVCSTEFKYVVKS